MHLDECLDFAQHPGAALGVGRAYDDKGARFLQGLKNSVGQGMRCRQLVLIAEAFAETPIGPSERRDATRQAEGLDGLLHFLRNLLVAGQVPVTDEGGVLVVVQACCARAFAVGRTCDAGLTRLGMCAVSAPRPASWAEYGVRRKFVMTRHASHVAIIGGVNPEWIQPCEKCRGMWCS